MGSQNRWAGTVVGVVMGVLFSAAVVLAGNLEPIAGPTEAGSQGQSSIYSPIVLKTGDSRSTGVPRTGQTTSYGTRDDGALKKGAVWPNPRFTDNWIGNESFKVFVGTVTDNLTGLIWLRNANCTNFFTGDNTGVNYRSWANALTAANSLASGKCGLADGSTAGQWRLPNVQELQSLIDFAYSNPALSNTPGTGQWTPGNPFTGVQSSAYWSGTTYLGNTLSAWTVDLDPGGLSDGIRRLPFKADAYYVWPVRDGQ